MTPPTHDPTKPHTAGAWTLGCPRCDADYRRYMELAADPLDVVDWGAPAPRHHILTVALVLLVFMDIVGIVLLAAMIVSWAGR
jgi:hypothetical protein